MKEVTDNIWIKKFRLVADQGNRRALFDLHVGDIVFNDCVLVQELNKKGYVQGNPTEYINSKGRKSYFIKRDIPKFLKPHVYVAALQLYSESLQEASRLLEAGGVS